MAPDKPRIVVIGAGFAGIALTQALADVADIKLVDGCVLALILCCTYCSSRSHAHSDACLTCSKAFLEIIWAGVRCPAKPCLCLAVRQASVVLPGSPSGFLCRWSRSLPTSACFHTPCAPAKPHMHAVLRHLRRPA